MKIILFLLIFITGNSVQASKRYQLKSEALSITSEKFQMSGDSIESEVRPGGKSAYILKFKNLSGIIFPRSLFFISPLITKDRIVAKKIKSNAQYVFYQYEFSSKTLDKMLIRAEFALDKETVFLIPLSSIYNPTGEQASYFSLNGNAVQKNEIEILGLYRTGILIKSKIKPKNLFLTHQDFLFEGQILDRSEVSYE